MRNLQSWRDLLPGRLSTSDLVRLAASLVLAVLLWGWVTEVQDPIRTEVFAGLTIAIPQLPEALRVVGDVEPVTVAIEGPRSVVDDVEPEDLEPRLDLDDVDGEGAFTVDVEVSEPDGTRSVRIEPAEVSIVVEAITAERFDLVVVREQPDDGTRRIGQVEQEVSEVTVSGPRSRVDRVRRVILPIAIDDQATDFSDRFAPVAQDALGSRIPEVTIVPDRVSASVQVSTQGKSVAVIPQVIGDPAVGFEISGRTSDPQQVLVDGPADVLDDLISVLTMPVDVSGATDTVTDRVGIETPSNVRVFEPADGMVSVEVQVRQAGVSQPLPGQTVVVVGLAEGLRAAVEPRTLDVVVQASESILGGLSADDIFVQVDARGLGPGTYQLPASVAVPPNVEWIRTEPDTVTVTITGPPSSTPSGLGGLSPPSITDPGPESTIPSTGP